MNSSLGSWPDVKQTHGGRRRRSWPVSVDATAGLSMLCLGALLALSQLTATFVLHLFHEPLDHVSVHLESVDYAFCEASFLFLQDMGDSIEFHPFPAPSLLGRKL